MLSLQEILKLRGERISVTCTNGKRVTGIYYTHISEMDNEPDGEAMVIDEGKWLMEVAVAEIVSIKVVDDGGR